MKPGIAIPLGVAGILAAIGTAIANANGLFVGHPSLAYWFWGASFALIALAIAGWVANARQRAHPTEPNLQSKHVFNIKQEANPQQNVYVGTADPRVALVEQEKLRQEDLIMARIKKDPNHKHLVEPTATDTSLSKSDARDALERLYLKKRLRRSTIDAPGDYRYWLDDLER